MAEPTTVTINWRLLDYPRELSDILYKLKYIDIKDCFIDKDLEKTQFEGLHIYKTSSDREYDVVPDRVKLMKDKSILFYMTKEFNLQDYPSVLMFIIKHCPYILEYVNETKLESIKINISQVVQHSNNSDKLCDKLDEFGHLKNWLEKENNEHGFNPFVLAALIRNFYRQDSTPFSIINSTQFLRIKNHIEIVNNLIETPERLETYILNPDSDNCYSGNLFSFIGNQIVESNVLNIYENNFDIKFLSYVSRLNLGERTNA